MQIGGVNHHSNYHHVTNCVHSKVVHKEKAEVTGGALQKETESRQPDATFWSEGRPSMSSRLASIWTGAKRMWGRIWGSDREENAEGQAAAAAVIVQFPGAQNNVAVEGVEKQRETTWQRVKVRIKEVAGQLRGQLTGRFAGFFAQNSFQTGQEQPRENMHRQDTHPEEELETDAFFMNDSYLMDSYDSTGSYRKLGEEVHGNISVRR